MTRILHGDSNEAIGKHKDGYQPRLTQVFRPMGKGQTLHVDFS